MYQVNDTVLYGTHGICRISDIIVKKIDKSNIQYYVLVPVYQNTTTLFVPVENQKLVSKMRRILSPSEIYTIIRSLPKEDLIWIDDDTQRYETYHAILQSGDRTQLVQLIKTLYLHQQERREQKKKLHSADEKFMKEAEHLLYEEFAYVLNIKREQVVPFITEQIEIEEKQS